jgi:hypothetical protein
MKIIKLYLLVVLIFLAYMAKSQVDFEQSYPGSADITQLELDGYKYYVTDAVNNKCLLYNTDHTLWKTIDIPVPPNNYIADISFVSQHLFNENDNVELLVIFAEYITSGEFPYYVYKTSVIGETGGALMNVEGGGYAFIEDAGDDNYKLLVYVYDFANSSLPVSTEIYEIPGSPLSSSESSIPSIKDSGNPYPNPAGSYVNIPYVLDKRDATGVLILFDGSGREIRRFKVGKDFNNIRILTSGLGKGVYFYTIQSEHNTTETKKLIVN